MTNSDYTALVLVIDQSGSMNSLKTTIDDALQEFLQEQVKLPGKLTLDSVFFSSTIEERHELLAISHEGELPDLSIKPNGMTALYDAVGSKITSFGKTLAGLPESERPGQVIFVIATDGLENSSTDYNRQAVAKLIKEQSEKFSWDFTFLGANQDAVLVARELNIDPSSALTFSADAGSATSALRAAGSYVTARRSGAQAGYSQEEREAAVATPSRER